jgi:Raf kinase inhibitor-like YbhB/YbcL family protein
VPESFVLSSPAFAHGAEIPPRHGCEGEGTSPPLAWTVPPRGTRSLAVTMEDATAPTETVVHWVAWGIDPAIRVLPEGVEPPLEGRNAGGGVGYLGPCPPPGRVHTYVFRLLALRWALEQAPGTTLDELEEAIAESLLDAAELVGTYARPPERALFELSLPTRRRLEALAARGCQIRGPQVEADPVAPGRGEAVHWFCDVVLPDGEEMKGRGATAEEAAVAAVTRAESAPQLDLIEPKDT